MFLTIAVHFILQLMGLSVYLVSCGVVGVEYKWSNIEPVSDQVVLGAQ